MTVRHPSTTATKGYWEPITATIDWCEDNYRYSSYIVEFWNTLTSFLFVLAGAFGFIQHFRLPLPARVAFIGVVVVGIGSILFHGTMKFSMQLLDELPMVFIEAYLISCFCPIWMKVILFMASVAFTIVYTINRTPLLFQSVYGALQVICVIIYFQGVRRHRTPNLTKVFIGSFSLTAFAFLLWNIDNNLCHSCLRPWKQRIWLPVVLELHAWWHVFSCLGAYWFIVGMCSIMPQVESLRPVIEFKCFGILPTLRVTRFTRVQKSSKKN
jgi:dihydroceramidase